MTTETREARQAERRAKRGNDASTRNRDLLRAFDQAKAAILSGTPMAVAAPSSRICADDLLAVTQMWDYIRDQALAGHPAGPIIPPPTGDRQQLTGEQTLGPGLYSLANTNIQSSGAGIMANNGTQCSIRLTNVDVLAGSSYALYAAPSSNTKLVNVSLHSDYYVARGQHARWESEDSDFYSATHSWRIYSNFGGFSLRDVYDVDYMRLGGGASDEWLSPEPFGGTATDPFLFSDGRIKARTQMTIYDKTNFVTFRAEDFTGTPKIRVELGAKNIRWENCPTVSLTQQPGKTWIDAKGQTQAQLAARGIVVNP